MKKHRIGHSLSLRMFIVILLLIILPLYMLSHYIRIKYENYFKAELEGTNINSLRQIEDDINMALNRMVSLSSMISTDESLQNNLMDEKKSYYDRMLVFNSMIKDIELNDLFDYQNVQITIIDNNYNIYSNWSLDFNDYYFLTVDKLVKESKDKQGHLVWDFFTDPFIIGDDFQNKYIVLRRALIFEHNRRYVATLIISMRQSELNRQLERYLFNKNDIILVCAADGEILMQLSRFDSTSDAFIQLIKGELVDGQKIRGVEYIEGSPYLISQYTFERRWDDGKSTFTIFHFLDYQTITDQINNIFRSINHVTLIVIFLLVCFAAFYSVVLIRPIRKLARQMDEYSLEKSASIPESVRKDEIGSLSKAYLRMEKKVRLLFSQLESESKAKEAYKLNYLRSQLNPHFLFNTLNMIRWISIIRKADSIVDSIDSLANMLEYNMAEGDGFVALEREIQNLQSYVNIYNYRYGNLYDMVINIPEELNGLRIVKFILQPIVENAVIHAFKEIREQGVITIEAWKIEKILEIKIIDNGRGISPEKLAEIQALTDNLEESQGDFVATNERIGIRNVHQQIKMLCGNEYGLKFVSEKGIGTTVVYRLPLIAAGGQSDEKIDDCR